MIQFEGETSAKLNITWENPFILLNRSGTMLSARRTELSDLSAWAVEQYNMTLLETQANESIAVLTTQGEIQLLWVNRKIITVRG